MQGFLHVASENAFLSYFYCKNGHNSVEIIASEKIKHILKTAYKKFA